jgi:RNA polymerase sigma-70 factor (ECF subfamily)
VSDLYLAAACAAGDPAALSHFDRDCLSAMDGALIRIGLSAQAADDAKQMIRRLLLVADGQPPRIAEYAGRGELRSWVRVAGIRAALDLRRRSDREIPVEVEIIERSVSQDSDPAIDYLKQVYRAEFKTAFAEAMDSLTDRERNLFGHQFVDGLTLDQIAALYRVHRATVARWNARARERLCARACESAWSRWRVSSG